MYVYRNSVMIWFICDKPFSYACMTRSFMTHEPLRSRAHSSVTWIIHMYDMTHEWYDYLRCIIRLICHLAPRYVWGSMSHTATHCSTLQYTASNCNTLQHTAIHCNSLQYTAAHCNALQHTATHCSTLQHTATHCNTLRHTATHCNTLQHTATYGDTLQRTATHCNTLQHAATRCYTLQNTAKLCKTLQPTLQRTAIHTRLCIMYDIWKSITNWLNARHPTLQGLELQHTLQHTASHKWLSIMHDMQIDHELAECATPDPSRPWTELCCSLVTCNTVNCNTVICVKWTSMTHRLNARHPTLQGPEVQHALQHTATQLYVSNEHRWRTGSMCDTCAFKALNCNTHCNTLQHALQHTATRSYVWNDHPWRAGWMCHNWTCKALKGNTHCNTLQHIYMYEMKIDDAPAECATPDAWHDSFICVTLSSTTHTATYYNNTLQHCNTLQHIHMNATHLHLQGLEMQHTLQHSTTRWQV